MNFFKCAVSHCIVTYAYRTFGQRNALHLEAVVEYTLGCRSAAYESQFFRTALFEVNVFKFRTIIECVCLNRFYRIGDGDRSKASAIFKGICKNIGKTCRKNYFGNFCGIRERLDSEVNLISDAVVARRKGNLRNTAVVCRVRKTCIVSVIGKRAGEDVTDRCGNFKNTLRADGYEYQRFYVSVRMIMEH